MSVIENTRQASQADDETIEISLNDILHFLKKSRRSILGGALIAGIFSAVYVFTTPNQYSSQLSVMPELQNRSVGSLGNISSLAGLAGLNIDNSGGADAIRPDLYPNILQSVPFAIYILRQNVSSKDSNKKQTLENFFKESSKKTIFNFSEENKSDQIQKNASGKNINSKVIELSKSQEALVNQVHNTITANFDRKTGLVSISSTMPDPQVAAATAQLALEYLTNYITSYRTEKARQQVNFLVQQLNEAKARYQAAEYALSSYRDRNRSLYLNTAKIEEQRLQADFILAQGVYNDLSKQLEQAKIKVSEEAPVFKILEPARVPLTKSGPKRLLTIIGGTILGSILGLVSFILWYFFVKNKN